MTLVKREKALKFLSTTLISLLLVSAFVTGAMVSPVKAQANIILWLVGNDTPGPGYYGGYFDVVKAIQASFLEIGIEVRWQTYDPYMWEDVVWELPLCLRNGTYDGDPSSHQYGVDGWDLTIFEWWLNPNSYIWLDEMAYSWGTPPTGWNIMSYNDTRSDYLYKKAMTTLDPTLHKRYMWAWQDELFHNPSVIPIYYADTYTATASYIDNYDPTAWLYDLSQLDINETKFNEVAPPTRKDIGSNTAIWGAVEPIWAWFPFATLTYTEETMNVLKGGMLFLGSREKMSYPPGGKYIVKPNLATKIPDASDWRKITEGGKEKWVVTIHLKQGITWTDGVEFNASDVAFSYNKELDSSVKSQAYGDYNFLLDRVEVVDRYTVDFIYKEGMGPDYDFAGYQTHGWALSILPWHQLKDENLAAWKGSTYNADPIPDSKDGLYQGTDKWTGTSKGLECLGPYVPIEYKSGEYVKLQLRHEYVNTLGWANTLPEYFIVRIIPEDATRILALQNLEVDFIEYPVAPVGVWENMIGWPTHRVSPYSYPASHPLWINHNNKVLSNRYVRLAMAYAIPYQKIFNDILPGWGVKTAHPGKTMVLPWQETFNTALPNYVYDIAKAKMYMDMYRYSLVGTDYTKGPLGDHDFSGEVDMSDYPIWVNNLGKYTYQLPWWPTNPVDPDNDNDGRVRLADIAPYWSDNVGKYYPYEGAW